MLEIYTPQILILRADQQVLSCFQFRFDKFSPHVQNVNVVDVIHWFVLCLHFYDLCQKELLLQLHDRLVMPAACSPSSNCVHSCLLQSARGRAGPVCQAKTPMPDGRSIVLYGNCSE